VEPYCGAASLFFRKVPSPIEVINDLNGEIVNFLRILRNQQDELISLLRQTPYARQEFNEAKMHSSNNSLEWARMFFVKANQSFSGNRRAWRYTSSEIFGGRAGCISKWAGRIENLPRFAARLLAAQIECSPALDVIGRFDTPTTLHYLDPPYLPSVRISRSEYDKFEMSLEDHQALLETLQNVKGMVLLSGYPNKLYNTTLSDWHQFSFQTISTMSRTTRPTRIECVWANPWACKVLKASGTRRRQLCAK